MSRSATLLLILALPAAALAQEVTGSISGSVTDPAGAAVAGAAVKLISEKTSAARNAATDSEGNFLFTAVAPGFYTVAVEHPGFKKLRKEGFELAPAAQLSAGTLKLEVGAVSEAVTVHAEGATIDLGTSSRGGIITSEEIQDLTVLNRDFSQFAELQPGIVVNVSQDVQTFSGNTTFNALGGRTTGNNISIDGVPSANTNQSNANTTISLDAVQTVEVKVANFEAEFGRSQGVTIMAVSKGGSQQFHGTGYYYDRNEAFNANNFFNNRAGLPQVEYRISYAGANLGGPLHIPGVNSTRNKLFFFLSSEEIREKRPKGLVNVTVPTQLERDGNFTKSIIGGKVVTVKDPSTGQPFAGNIIPASRILPSTQAYLNLLPLPNFTNTAISNNQYNYAYQESLNVPKRVETGRLDYNFSSNTMMYARFNYWWEDQQGSAVSASNTSWGWLDSHYTAITPSATLSATHILNATTVLQGTLGFQRFTEDGPPLSQSEVNSRTRTATGINIPQFTPSINPLNLVPAATFGGVPNAANPSYNSRFPLRGVENTYNLNGTLNKTAGQHALKAGIYGEHWQAMKGLNAASFAGTMTFSTDSNNPLDTGYAYSNALLGVLDSYTEASSRPPMYEYTTNWEWFAQDSWKVTRRFTLDLGVRWGWAVPWHSNVGQEAGFVPWLWNPQQAVKLIQPVLVNGKRMGKDPVTGQILPAVDIGAISPNSGNASNGIVYRATNPSWPEGLRYTDGIKTAPRFGFSWDPIGDAKTVIRGGGGIFYNVHDQDNWSNNIEYTQPIQYTPVIYYTTVQSFINQAGYVSPGTIQGFDPYQHIQKTMNFSLNVQRDIGWGSVLDVAYVGSLGRHLEERMNLNTTPLGANFRQQNIDPTTNKALPSQFLRPYTGYGDINYYFFGGNSSYHSLQTTLRRRYKHGLTYGVVWTWSKAMDYADTEGNAATTTVSSVINNKVWNYGKAGFDHTHVFRFYWNYNIPRASAVLNRSLVRAVFDNWQLSGIATFQSGAPTGISYSFSPSQDITGSTDAGRVILVANPNLPKDQRSFNQAFNAAAIAAPPVAACQVANTPSICWGNAPKDVFRGPGIDNWDTSLFKNIPITERLRGQFRVEAYNVFNHTQFTTVNTSAQFNASGAQTNASFGQYTAAANARRLQLALRLTF